MTFLTCGIDIKASTARLVVLKGTNSDYEIVETKFKKIDLADHANQGDVLSFHQAISSFFETMGISKVGIKARSTKGEFSGGPISFKIEGIIQTIRVDVKIVHSATISATLKKKQIDLDQVGINKYQYDAFKVAYHLLGD